MGRAFEVRKASMMKTGLAKSKLYSKFGKEIYVAAKNGQPDVELNPTLKRICEKAKKNQVPADIIKRAIDKAKGGADENYQRVMYEGFGPNNSNIMVECLTDNLNRTVADVRNCFTKSNSKLGVSGSVSHMFSHQAIFSFEFGSEEEILEMLLLDDVEVEDIESEDGIITVYAPTTSYSKVKESLEKNIEGINFEIDEITHTPQNFITISTDEDKNNYEKLINMLNELEDVQEIYHNVSFTGGS